MEGFGSTGEFDQVTFQRLGEGVKEAPDGARLKLLVARFPPFMENGWNRPVWHDADVACPDDEIMGCTVVEVSLLVGGEPGGIAAPRPGTWR